MCRCKALLSAGSIVLLIGASAPAAVEAELAGARSRMQATQADPALTRDADEQSDVLSRPVTLDLVDTPLNTALETIARLAGFTLAYNPDILPAGRTVTLNAAGLSARDALTRVLEGTGLEPTVIGTGQLTFVRRPDTPARTGDRAAAVAQQAVVTGTVTDEATGAALRGAQIRVDASELSTVTDAEGRYTLEDVPPGAHTLVARIIGYREGRQEVTVTAGTTTSVDFALAVSALPLDEMVVTGTIVATPLRAVPSPVSVVTAADIEQRGLVRLDDILRSIPGVGVITRDQQEYLADIYVRGASTFAGGTIKTYLDGIEIANPAYTLNQIDPRLIERIEMIRGPQASTLYGSEAISGVLQIFTKKGHLGARQPRVETTVMGGGLQSHYKDGPTPFQSHNIGISGGDNRLSYNLTTSYNSMGDWIEDDLIDELGWDVSNSARSDWGIFAGARYTNDRITAEFSARVLNRSRGAPLERSVTEPSRSGRWNYPYFTKPSGLDIDLDYQTYGVTVTYDASSEWRHRLTIGQDENSIQIRQPNPRQTTPADTLLLYSVENWRARSLAYSTSIGSSISETLSWSLQAGFDRTHFEQRSVTTSDARQLEGGLGNGGANLTVGNITNFGYFVQMQTAWWDQVFLTTGLRTDGSTGFGDDSGLAWSPRVGVAHLLELGRVTVKTRAAYGTAIRPPEAEQKLGQTLSCCLTVSNERLAPEAQAGYDFGLEMYLGGALSLSLTRYDQEARDMIQLVRLSDPSVTPEVRQFQNVGRIRNAGWEIDFTAWLAPVTVSGHWTVMNSTVEELSPTYTGTDFVIGARPFNVPRNTGAVTIAYSASRLGLSLSMSHKGSWQEIGWIPYLEAVVGTDPNRDAFTGNTRDYIDDYPAVQRYALSVKYEATRHLALLLNVDNLFNDASTSRRDIDLVEARRIGVGARLAFNL